MQVGRYEVLEELGQGGMARIFLAHDPRVRRRVALKVLLEANQAASRYRTRFLREAHALARIAHPNVARVYELGEHQGAPFIVMAYYPRGSLADALSRSGPLPVAEVVKLGLELTRGLEAVHAQGVLHRDLKPDNVLFEEEGVALLADFGLAKDLGRESTTQDLTKSGTLQGTPGFWAPEQALGRAEGTGPWTDVYGLGAILYAALTGQPPILGESLIAILAATETEAPRPLRAFRDDVPPELEALVLRCLRKEPSERWPSATALREALSECPTEAPRPRRPWRAFALALAGACLGGALSYHLGEEGESPRESPRASLERPPQSPAASSPSPPEASPSASPPLDPSTAEELYQRGLADVEAERFEAAAALFQEGARAGHPGAQNALGMLYVKGQGLEANPQRALEHFRRAAEAGYPQASLNLGLMYQRGQGVEQDLPRARALLRHAAKAGLPDGQCGLGIMLYEGQGGPADPKEGVRLLRLAAQARRLTALRYLGHAYSNGKGVAANHSAAFRIFTQAAEAGDLESLVALAKHHRMGKGTPRDTERAFELLLEAAKRGSRSGAFLLAVFYDLGSGTPENPAEAQRWFRVAAEAGDPRAMHGLAVLLSSGRGVPKDLVEARQWSRKAAAAGNLNAMHGFGLALTKGTGGPRNEAEGFQWLERAAKAGHVEAMFSLGAGLSDGKGVEDPPRAAHWYHQAATRGHTKAAFNFALLLDSQPDPARKAQALTLYRRAARAGDPKAMVTLGRKLALGEGVAPDREQALKWLHEAAASDDLDSRTQAQALLERLNR